MNAMTDQSDILPGKYFMLDTQLNLTDYDTYYLILPRDSTLPMELRTTVVASVDSFIVERHFPPSSGDLASLPGLCHTHVCTTRTRRLCQGNKK
jgi:hypothetical protein